MTCLECVTPLYKFIAHVDAVKFLLDGSLKFTPIPELNDPSELVPAVDTEAVAASRERLRNDGYSDADMVHLRRQGALLQRLAPDHQAIPVPESAGLATAQFRARFYDNTQLLERMLRQTADLMASKVGMFCLSVRMDSLPMWAHYAANAKGVAVEFKDLNHVFRGDDTGVLREPTFVRYERERLGVTFDPQSHEALFFAKFEDWRYEREVRVVLPLDECRTVYAGGLRLHVFDVPKRLIARLILGWRVPDDDVNSVVDYVRSRNPAVEIVRTRIQNGQVEIADRVNP
jgi:hypothetical protein